MVFGIPPLGNRIAYYRIGWQKSASQLWLIFDASAGTMIGPSFLHTAAYWLMLALRDAVPRKMPLAWAEFATLRKNLLKIGARVVEKAARIRIHFASACPEAALFRLLAGRLAASGP